jgi:Fe2+ or Zn2+ uptake regulation protein
MRLDEDISKLVRALARYLHDNPRASDTCEGALDWWLGRQGGATWQQVQDALDTLVNFGVVVRVAAADGKVRYRCASDDAATRVRLATLARGEE